MGAGSEELSLTEMSIETAIGQIDKTNSNKSPGPDDAEQRSPTGNGWTGAGSIYPHTFTAGEQSNGR